MKKSKIRDFDPESLLDPAPSSSSDEHSDSELLDAADDNAGREHYATVGKSKLRKPVEVPLGPKYAGRGVSRKELEDSDSDDPFARSLDEEDSEETDDQDEHGIQELQIDSGNDSEEQQHNGDFDEEMENGVGEDDEDDFGSATEDESDINSDIESSDKDKSEADSKSGTSAVRDMMKDSKAFASTLAAGAQSDVAKGEAVKTQRKMFDTLLNARIRLQKSLISTNSMVAEPYKEESAQGASIEAAEAAALTLLNNLTNLRLSLEEARTGNKRKRAQFESTTPSPDIWASMQHTEKNALHHRKAVLERWSSKTKATTVTNNKARLNASAQQTITEVLDSQLTSPHLLTRTQTPRSCAPLQSSIKGAQPDPAIYDDADFYGLLLKELLEQRSSDLSANGTAEFVVQAPWQVARENKTKKVVDTKASKGRRLRYTVQEKLQNFMAPEERGQWGDRQREELFSSLFGQRLELGEHDEVQSEQEDVDDEEAGLMLFRS